MSSTLANQLLASKDYFERSTRVLDEADSTFRPHEGMMTVAQQVAHTAQTLDWFVEGASRPEGFDLDFEKHAGVLEQVTSLAVARRMLEDAFANVVKFVASLSPADSPVRCPTDRSWAVNRSATLCGRSSSTPRTTVERSRCTPARSAKCPRCRMPAEAVR